MGQRANYIIIKDNEPTIYYTKWGANILGYTLSYGPDQLVKDIQSYYEITAGLLNETWAEGSMLLNLDKQEVLFYDGEIGINSVFYKEALFEMYAQTTWKDWSIQWAMNGQADIAAYLGIPREQVNEQFESIPNKPRLSPDYPGHLFSHLLIIIRENGAVSKLTPWPVHTLFNVDYDEIMHMQEKLDCIDYQTLDRSQLFEFVVIDEPARTIDVYYSYPFFVEEKLFVLNNLKNWHIQYRREGYKWLDNRLQLEYKLKQPEIQAVKDNLDYVFVRNEFFNSIYLNDYREWILKSKYYQLSL